MKKILKSMMVLMLALMLSVSAIQADGSTKPSKVQEAEKQSVRYRIPSQIAAQQAMNTFAYRGVGDSEWIHIKPYVFKDNLEFNMQLEVNKDYEVVVNYVKNRNFYKAVISQVRLDEVQGLTVQATEDGMVSVLPPVEGEEHVLQQLKDPVKQAFGANSYKLVDFNVEEAPKYFEMYDIDGTRFPLEMGSFLTFYIPDSSRTLSDDESYSYKIEMPGFEYASAKLRPGETGMSAPIITDIVGHQVDATFMKIDIALTPKQSVKHLTLPSLSADTEVILSSLSGQSNLSLDGNMVAIDLQNLAEDTIHIQLKANNYAPIVLELHVDSTGIKLMNEAVVKDNTSHFSFDPETAVFEFRQLPSSPVEPSGTGEATVSINEATRLFGLDTAIEPGVSRTGALRIQNNSNSAYRVTDVVVNQSSSFNNRMLRTDSALVRKYYETFNPDYTIEDGSAAFLFDFEAINGISFYEGLLQAVQLDQPEIQSLEALSAQEIATIFSNDYSFAASRWGGNPNADYAYAISTSQFGIIESDAKMLELAKHHLFHNALYFSLDTDITGPLHPTSSGNQEVYRFGNYQTRPEALNQKLKALFDKIGVIDPQESINLNALSYVLVGDLIHDAFRPALENINFGFELKLGIVGIDGYVFEDLNVNGLFDDGEPVIPGHAVTLQNTSGSVYTTTSDQSGYYAFTEVDPGNYKLETASKENYEFTVRNDARNGNKFDEHGRIESIQVEADENYHLNAGFKSQEVFSVSAEHRIHDKNDHYIRTEATETQSGLKSQQYSFESKTFEGYELNRIEGSDVSGNFAENLEPVQFIYTPKSALLTVRYENDKGNAIAKEKIENLYYLDTYEVAPIEIQDYTFKTLKAESDAQKGEIKKDSTVITFIYEKNKPGPVKPEPEKPGPVKPKPEKPDPVKPNPIKPTPVQPSPVTPGSEEKPKLPATGMSNTLMTVGMIGIGLGLAFFALSIVKRKNKDTHS